MLDLPTKKPIQPFLVATCTLETILTEARYRSVMPKTAIQLFIYEHLGEYYISEKDGKQEKVSLEKLAKLYKNLVIKKRRRAQMTYTALAYATLIVTI